MGLKEQKLELKRAFQGREALGKPIGFGLVPGGVIP